MVIGHKYINVERSINFYVVAPLGEKARPLEKDKASRASEWLEPLSTGPSTGSPGAPLQLLCAILELLEAPMQLFFVAKLKYAICVAKRQHTTFWTQQSWNTHPGEFLVGIFITLGEGAAY